MIVGWPDFHVVSLHQLMEVYTLNVIQMEPHITGFVTNLLASQALTKECPMLLRMPGQV